MSEGKKPFWSMVAKLGVDENFVPQWELYALGPQFCGGEKKMLARVYPEVLMDLRVEEPDFNSPPEVEAFIEYLRTLQDSCKEETV